MRTEEMDDQEWAQIVARLRLCAVQYRSMSALQKAINLTNKTIKTILIGRQPPLMTQLYIEDWVKKEEERRKKK